MATNGRKTTRKTSTAAELKARSTKKLATRDIESIETNDFLTAAQEKMCLALSYLDVTQLSQAKATELIAVIKQLFDITQVLQGKPTAIHANNNRKALKDLIPAVLREAERRGMQVSGQVIEGEVIKVEALGGGAQGHIPPGGFVPGPIPPSPESEFSKLLNDF